MSFNEEKIHIMPLHLHIIMMSVSQELVSNRSPATAQPHSLIALFKTKYEDSKNHVIATSLLCPRDVIERLIRSGTVHSSGINKIEVIMKHLLPNSYIRSIKLKFFKKPELGMEAK